jgi:hypothetical protein
MGGFLPHIGQCYCGRIWELPSSGSLHCVIKEHDNAGSAYVWLHFRRKSVGTYCCWFRNWYVTQNGESIEFYMFCLKLFRRVCTKALTNFAVSVSPSERNSSEITEPICMKFAIGTSTTICRHFHILINIGQQSGYYTRTCTIFGANPESNSLICTVVKSTADISCRKNKTRSL